MAETACARRCSIRLVVCVGTFFILAFPVARSWLLSSVPIERVADKIELDLIHLLSTTTGIEVLEKAYNDSRSRINFREVNGQQLVTDVTQSFGRIFGRKIEALQKTLSHTNFWTKKYQWNSKIKETDIKYHHARDLNESAEYFENNEQYGRRVSFENSSAHIPVDIYKGDVEILNSLAWTADMDQVWIENKKRDQGLLWQYFGSLSGVLRVYPASKWRRKAAADLYDVRRRPWYTQGASSPKEMLILVDRSGSSHGQALSLMKHSVKSILDTVGENDFVNVANFSETASLVGCFSTLVQGNLRNKQRLSHYVDTMMAGGVASYAAGLEFAFQQLENFTWLQNRSESNMGAGCNQVIMFLTDGGTEMPVDVIRRYNANKTVRIFSFAVGPVASAIPAVKWIGCSNRGYFYQVPAMGAIRAKVQDYISYLARPKAFAPEGHFTTSVHLDELGLGLLASITVPVFNQSQEAHNQTLLGVLGVDLSVTDLVDSIPREKFGPGGYAFAINSNGYVIFHPELKILELSIGNPPSVDFIEIEEETEDLDHIRREMIDQKTGQRRTRTYITGLGEKHADIKERTYYYGPIPRTDFSLGIVIPEYYKVYIDSLEHINFTAMHHLQLNNTAVLLEYKRYCPQLKYSSASFETFLNLLQTNLTSCDKNRVHHLLFDAEIVFKLYSYWLLLGKQTPGLFQDSIVSVIAETNSGLTLIHPQNGTTFELFETNLNPWDRVHFRRAMENNIWIYTLLQKTDENGNLTEKFIMATKSIGLGQSDYRIAAVSAILSYQKFSEKVTDTVNRHASKSIFYILDDGGHMLYTNAQDLEQFIGYFFGSIEPNIMADLVEKQFYFSRVQRDYQRMCSTQGPKNSGIRIIPSFLYELLSLRWWFSTSAWAYIQIYSWLFHRTSSSSSMTLEEEILAEQNHRMCIMALYQYHFNYKFGSRSIMDGLISCNNCTRHYQASRLQESNLLLVVVENTEDCNCGKTPLPYQPEEIDSPFVADECPVTVRYRRKPPCYDEGPNDAAGYCTGSSLMTSLPVLSLCLLFAIFRSPCLHRQL